MDATNNNNEVSKPSSSKPGKSRRSNRRRGGKDNNVKQYNKPTTTDTSVTETRDPSVVKDSVRRINDPAWYMYSPEQVSAVARIPFSEKFGDMLPIVDHNLVTSWGNTTRRLFTRKETAVPGIAAIRVRPTFGLNLEITDPLNLCATELYTEVRKANNGRKNYDPSDLMIHVMAMADVFSFIMWCKKIYGLAFMYSTMNLYYGKALLRACGVNAENITINLANFRYWLNTFIHRVEAYCVPREINLFNRRAFILADVYSESEAVVKDQLYTFVPDGFFKFALDDNGAGMLDYITVETSNGNYIFDDFVTLGESLLENITQDEDFGLMSGDLLKAYGDGGMIEIDELPEIYEVVPHYDHEVLHQIMNCTPNEFFHRADTSQIDFAYYEDQSVQTDDPRYNQSYTSGKVYQTPKGVLVHGFAYWVDDVTNIDDATRTLLFDESLNVVLNTDLPIADEGHVMEMTRLAFSMSNPPEHWSGAGKNDKKHHWPINFVTCGSEIVTGIYIYVNDRRQNMQIPGSTLSKYAITNKCIYYDDTGAIVGSVGNTEIKLRQQFAYLPYMIEIKEEVVGGNHHYYAGYLLQNLSNYTLIDSDQLQRIHNVAMFSLVHVPSAMRLINK